jgi:hypothetical protein
VGSALALAIAGCDQESPHVAPLQETPDQFAQAESGPEVEISVRPAIYVPQSGDASTASTSNGTNQDAPKPDAAKPHHHRHHQTPAVIVHPDTTDDQTKNSDPNQQPPWHDQLEKAKQNQDDQGWKHGESNPNDGSDPGNDPPKQDDGG